MCLCWSNWLVCIPMIINRFTFRQWWNLVKYRNTVNIWCWPEKWLRTTAAAVWKVYHLTYNSIHNMTHHSQNSVRQLELSWKLFLVYLLSIWSVSMGDFWVLRRWGFCVWGDKRRRGGEKLQSFDWRVSTCRFELLSNLVEMKIGRTTLIVCFVWLVCRSVFWWMFTRTKHRTNEIESSSYR